MVSHGTLLWDTDLSVVGEALRVKQAKIESKGIKSVRARVANITEFLPENPPDIMTFRQMIIDSVNSENPLEEYVLSEMIGRTFTSFRKNAIKPGSGILASRQLSVSSGRSAMGAVALKPGWMSAVEG